MLIADKEKKGKVKEEDALAYLSDQLLVLSERIQQFERKQMIQSVNYIYEKLSSE